MEAPRFATASFPNSFFPDAVLADRLYAERRIGPNVRAQLRASGHGVHERPDFEFDARAIAFALDLKAPAPGSRVLAAVAHPHRSGYAVGRRPRDHKSQRRLGRDLRSPSRTDPC